ncbi:MAG TPA: chemotaxis response regulator protein-glutamate methylesterase [Gammaproteobacteria bacterium]|nr:chemotaxis response regulator protein-glutamate methylesterase [Gammaproteobacteria bacterium]
MAVRVLVVEDSGFFRRRIVAMLGSDPRIEVVGQAVNGLEAVTQLERLRPDVITMDIEMPLMDGITAVRKIMSTHPTPILMFSILTTEGARATLDALEAGAMDFIPKRFSEVTGGQEDLRRQLCAKVVALGGTKLHLARPSKTLADAPRHPSSGAGQRYRLGALASSTGGPAALPRVLSSLPADLPVPLVIAQHMPANFTPSFAQRLDQQCAIRVRHAEDGDPLLPGTALLAPGGKQMTVERRGGQHVVRVRESDPSLNYRPSADLMFSSLAEQYGGQVLSIILTGMGADGREGARLLKQKGATVWAQDQASSVIYGMPGAVARANLTDEILDLAAIGPGLARMFH